LQVAPLSYKHYYLSQNDATTLFHNIMNNAVKYGATSLNIYFEEQKKYLTIYIQDNGQGMDAAELPYIFDKFYRIQKDNVHNTKGLGIGLFLVKNIVNKYHAHISVKSQVNHGTTIIIQLPLEIKP